MTRFLWRENLHLFFILIRLPLSVAVAGSALAGFALYEAPVAFFPAAAAGFGVLCLAAGCSALNQTQERGWDALMQRTCQRPLACGRWSPAIGLIVAILLILTGLIVLALQENGAGALIGLFAVSWYNGIYTPMKRYSGFAILPGSLCGALPPLIGWITAGGSMFDYRIVTLAMLFFLWQIPHFWVLLTRHQADYQRAGFPNLFDHFSSLQSHRLIALWTLALATALLLPPALGFLKFNSWAATYLGSVFLMYILAISTFFRISHTSPRLFFSTLNGAMTAATLIMVFSKMMG